MLSRIWRVRRGRAMVAAASCAAAAVLLLWYPQAAATGVSRGLAVCGRVILPSLLPFLVLAGFLVRSGLAASIGRRLDRPMKWLFGLPGCCGTAVLLGWIGGYPAGGAAAAELYDNGCIGKEDARRLLRFCIGGGPAFILCAVGAGMLHSVAAGGLLLLAQLLAATVIGLSGRSGGDRMPQRTHPAPQTLPYAAAFVESVRAACGTLLTMCGFVVLCAALLSLFDACGLSEAFYRTISTPLHWAALPAEPLRAVLPCLMEVSCGCVEAACTGAAAPFLLGCALGWGGLSVIGQLSAVLTPCGLMDGGFLRSRGLQALLGGLFSALLFRFIPISWSAEYATAALVDTAVTGTSNGLGGAAFGTAALLALCVMFLLTARPREQV